MITIGHGAGGRLSRALIKDHFLTAFDNPVLSDLQDAAVLADMAITTDAYVITPRVFPGGDLGRLAVSGTVNDLAMAGAVPLGLTAAFILEEGLSLSELDRVVRSMADTAKEAEVEIVAGDTKVVPRGACDAIFITTAGIGRLAPGFRPHTSRVAPGDVVIVSGTVADHGMAVMTARQHLSVSGSLESDVAPIACLVTALREADIQVHALRDPTRGGIASSLNEFAESAGGTIVLDEASIPINPGTKTACELLGIDPLHVANEGKLLAVVPADDAKRALQSLKHHPLGRAAAVIGRVESGKPRLVLETVLGTRRIVRLPEAELLPRIC
jgi:hydrogenase expression/formation protein HypE